MRPRNSKLLKNKQIAKNSSGQAVGQWCGSRGTISPVFSINGL
uniref:Late transcription unit A n=2 Tax=unclassified Caudoviricetes TaxID=2788787 RepID=A0A8S5VAR4_9CAUD|nr:MAG TPA: Late transcription unit A [Siphoviridae sp. ctfrT39]DAG03866.1 MAG TPA: Late transcription unit A [Siphoviridae sp. ct0vA12]